MEYKQPDARFLWSCCHAQYKTGIQVFNFGRSKLNEEKSADNYSADIVSIKYWFSFACSHVFIMFCG